MKDHSWHPHTIPVGEGGDTSSRAALTFGIAFLGCALRDRLLEGCGPQSCKARVGVNIVRCGLSMFTSTCCPSEHVHFHDLQEALLPPPPNTHFLYSSSVPGLSACASLFSPAPVRNTAPTAPLGRHEAAASAAAPSAPAAAAAAAAAADASPNCSCSMSVTGSREDSSRHGEGRTSPSRT